jgi:hypothetical protein
LLYSASPVLLLCLGPTRKSLVCRASRLQLGKQRTSQSAASASRKDVAAWTLAPLLLQRRVVVVDVDRNTTRSPVSTLQHSRLCFSATGPVFAWLVMRHKAASGMISATPCGVVCLPIESY